jgi:uncharacterized damage-inducible protein DinB
MTNQELLSIAEQNHWAITTNLKDLSEADCLIKVGEDGTHANWVLGHLVHSRYWLFKTIKANTSEDANTIEAAYKRGTTASYTAVFSSQHLQEAFNQTQNQLETLLPNLDLSQAREGRFATLGKFIEFILWHETYHLGQFGMFRRLAGKKGAI